MAKMLGKAKNNLDNLNQGTRNTLDKLQSFNDMFGNTRGQQQEHIQTLLEENRKDNIVRQNFINNSTKKLRTQQEYLIKKQEQVKARDNFRTNKLFSLNTDGTNKIRNLGYDTSDSVFNEKEKSINDISSQYDFSDSAIAVDNKHLKAMKNNLEKNKDMLNKSFTALKSSGKTDDEIAFIGNEMFKAVGEFSEEQEKTRERLKEIEPLLTDGKEKFSENMKESYAEAEVMKLRSFEAMKEMKGEANSLGVIDDWINSHPEMYASGENGLLSKATRGITSFGFGFVNDIDNAIKANPERTATFAMIGAAVGVGAFTVATGGSGAVVASPLLASGATASGAVAGVSIPIIGSSSAGLATSTGLATLYGGMSGASASVVNERYNKETARLYDQYIKEGLDPNVAKITAQSMGGVTTAIDVKNIGIVSKGIPFVNDFADKVASKFSKNAYNKLSKLAIGYGLELSVLSADSTAQEYFVNTARRLSDEITNKGTSLPEAMLLSLTHPINGDEKNADFYLETLKQSFSTMLFMPMISRAKKLPDLVGEQYEARQRDKSFLEQSKQVFEADNFDKLVNTFHSDKMPINQRMEFNQMLLDISDTSNQIINNSTLYTKKEKAEFKAIQQKADKYYDNDMAKNYLNDRTINISKTGYSYIKNKMVDSISNGLIDPLKDLDNGTQLNKVVVDKYKEAEAYNGVVNTVETLHSRNLSNGEIAHSILDLLPEKKRNLMESSQIVNSILQVNQEAKYQVARDNKINNETIVNSVMSNAKRKVFDNDASVTELKKDAQINKLELKSNINDEKRNAELTELEKNIKIRKEGINSSELKNIDAEIVKEDNLKVDKKKVKEYKNSKIFEVPIDDINVDPERFQFRLKGTDITNKFGVDNKFNKDLSGVVHLYRDTDNQLYVIDGHHRVELAKQGGTDTISSKIIDSADLNVKEARIFGAKLNIADGNADILDVAKLVKNSDITKKDFKDYNINTNSNLYRDGIALSTANEELYNKVLIGRADPEMVAEISRNFENKDTQSKIFDFMKSAENKNKEIKKSDIKYLKGAFYDSEGTDNNWNFFKLMGEDDSVSLVNEKIDLMNYLNKSLKDKKNLFKKVTKNKNVEMLEDIADIRTEDGKKVVKDTELLQNAFDRAYSYPGQNKHFHNLMKDFSQKLYDTPNKANSIYKEFTDSALKLIEDGKMNTLGYDVETYNQMFKNKDTAHTAQENVKPNISLMVSDKFNNKNLFEYTGKLKKSYIESVKEEKVKPTLVNNETNDKVLKELSIGIDGIRKKEYFNDLLFNFDGTDGKKKMTKEELRASGYDNLSEDVVVKGMLENKNGLDVVTLSNSADKTTLAEETVHYILNKEVKNNTNVGKEIKKYISNTESQLEKVGMKNIYGDEIFTKSYLNEKFGYAIDGNNLGVKMPENIYKMVDNILGKEFVETVFNGKIPDDFNYNKPSILKEDFIKQKSIPTKIDEAKLKTSVDINSEEFKKWFGKSRIKDFKGDPLVVYGNLSEVNDRFTTYKKDGGENIENYLSLKKVYPAMSNEAIDYDDLIKRGFDSVEFKNKKGYEYLLLDKNKNKNINIYDNEHLKNIELPDYQIESAESRTHKQVKRLQEINPDVYNVFKDNIDAVYEVRGNKVQMSNAIMNIAENGAETIYNKVLGKLSNNEFLGLSDVANVKALHQYYSQIGDQEKAVHLFNINTEATSESGAILQLQRDNFLVDDWGYSKTIQKNVFDKGMNEPRKKIVNQGYEKLSNEIKNINNDAIDKIIPTLNVSEETAISIKKHFKYGIGDDLSSYLSEYANVPYDEASSISSDIKNKIYEATKNSKVEAIKKLNKNKKFDYDASIENMSTNSFLDKNSKNYDLFNGDIASMNKIGYINSSNFKEISNRINEVRNMSDPIQKQEAMSRLNRDISSEYVSTTGEKLTTLNVISLLLKGDLTMRNALGNVVIDTSEHVSRNTVGILVDKIVGKKTGMQTNTFINPVDAVKAKSKIYKDVVIGETKSIWNEEPTVVFNKYNQDGIETGKKLDARLDKKVLEKANYGGNEQMELQGVGKFEVPVLDRTKVFKNPILHTMEKMINITLSAPDKASFNSSAMEEVMRQVKILNDNGIEVTPSMSSDILERAIEQATYSTFTNDTALTDATMGIKKGANKLSSSALNKVGFKADSDYGLGSLIMPFSKTGANLANKAIDYSPIGYASSFGTYKKLKNDVTAFNVSGRKNAELQAKVFSGQNNFVKEVSRATLGTSFILGGMALKKGGHLTVNEVDDLDDSKKVKTFLKDKGYQPFSVKFNYGGTEHYLDYSWLDPVSASMSLGASIQGEIDNGTSQQGITNTVMNMGKLFVKKYSDVSVLSNAIDKVSSEDSLGESLISTIAGMPRMFVPAVLRQIAMFADPHSKDTWDSNPFKKAMNDVAVSIPGLRNTFPDRVDALGNSIAFTDDRETVIDYAKSFGNTMINPSRTSTLKLDDTERELLDIYNRTGNADVIPGKLRNDFKGVKLDKLDFEQVSITRGLLIKSELEDYLSNRTRDDEIDAKVIKKIISKCNKQVRDSVEYSLEAGGYFD